MILSKFSYIKNDSSIFQAIENLNNNNLYGLVLVVDKNKNLLGTVTDGDVRRAIINKVDLNSKVEKIMKKTPKCIDYKEKDNKYLIHEKFTKLKIRHLIVLKKKKIYDVLIQNNNYNTDLFDIPVIIMAGGKGKRLMPLTKNLPKPLIKIGNEAIITRIIKNLASNNFKKIVVIINYLGSKIKKKLGDGKRFGVEINYINEKKRMGTVGGLSMMKNFNFKNFILLNADILTNINYVELLKSHIKKKSMLTICTVKYNYEMPYGIINRDTDKFNEIIEKPTFSHEINAGIYVINSKTLKFIKKKYMDIDDFINIVLKKKFKITVFPIYENWSEIGRKKHLDKVLEKFSYEK